MIYATSIAPNTDQVVNTNRGRQATSLLGIKSIFMGEI